MGLMRKLMMGCASDGMRTLVNTTEEHTSLQSMDTPIKMKVGASYSISWTGAMPTTGGYIYPFKVYGGYGVVSDMCNIRLKKETSAIDIFATLFGSTVNNISMNLSGTATLELRFTITGATENNDGFTVYTIDTVFYVNGNVTCRESGIQNGSNVGEGLRYYNNLAGTFVIKKLS